MTRHSLGYLLSERAKAQKQFIPISTEQNEQPIQTKEITQTIESKTPTTITSEDTASVHFAILDSIDVSTDETKNNDAINVIAEEEKHQLTHDDNQNIPRIKSGEE